MKNLALILGLLVSVYAQADSCSCPAVSCDIGTASGCSVSCNDDNEPFPGSQAAVCNCGASCIESGELTTLSGSNSCSCN